MTNIGTSVVFKRSLFRGTFKLQILKMGPKNGARFRQVVATYLDVLLSSSLIVTV